MTKGAKKMFALFSVALIFVAIIIYYFGAFYPSFNKISKKEFKIPGLDTSFVPQGLEYLSNEKVFLVSGYMSNGEPSRVYLVSEDTGETIKYVTLKSELGDYTLHAGGIKSVGDSLWIAGDKRLEHLSVAELLSAPNASSINIKKTFEPGNGCDFLWIYEDYLVVGEFYRKNKFETSPMHNVKVTENEENNALAYAYKIDGTSNIGIDENLSFVLSIPSNVQGISLNSNGDIVLSVSFSIPSSKIVVYENCLKNNAGKITLNNTSVALYILCDSLIKKQIKAPTMTEEIILHNDRVFVLFESACKKYKFINRTRTKQVMSLEL